MKLLRLKLNSDFRSLKAGFEIDFLRKFEKGKAYDFMPYCLAGRNGSGKSNVLEALAAIFYHIECMYLNYKPEGFEEDTVLQDLKDIGDEIDSDEVNIQGVFSPKDSYPDAFELEYLTFSPTPPKPYRTHDSHEIDDAVNPFVDAHICIKKMAKERPIVRWINRNEFDTGKSDVLERREVKEILPDYIIGYSSGENEILSLPFFKMRFINFDEYEDRLRNEFDYQQPEGRLVYIDNQFSQAIFLSNFLIQEESLLKPIYTTIGVKRIKQFRIIIRQNVQIQKFRLDENSPTEEQPISDDLNITFELTSKIQSTIDKFKSCATAQLFDTENKMLYLDYFVNSETQKAFRLMFENDALTLFRAFQILLTLNLYSVSRSLKMDLYQSSSLYVNETVPTLASDERIMRFKDLEIDKEFTNEDIYNKSLSDGEHQFLHSINLFLLFKNTNSLFLLDEPETHFNPDWRAKFISTLRDCLEDKKQQRLREILITTHSPFIISDSHERSVLKFIKNPETGVVKCERPDFKTFGASVNQITIEIFDKPDTIGDLANESINNFEKKYEEGQNIEELIKEINDKMGDSIEKTILINRLLRNLKQ